MNHKHSKRHHSESGIDIPEYHRHLSVDNMESIEYCQIHTESITKINKIDNEIRY